MSELLKVFPEISLVLVFVALPFFYLTLATDVHKEYADLVKTAVGIKDLTTYQFQELTKQANASVHVFELDWWVIGAAAVLFGAIVNLNALAETSTHLKDICAEPRFSQAQADCPSPTAMTTGKDFQGPFASATACGGMRRILAIYGAVVGLLFCFKIWWARVTAAKHLRTIFSSLYCQPDHSTP